MFAMFHDKKSLKQNKFKKYSKTIQNIDKWDSPKTSSLVIVRRNWQGVLKEWLRVVLEGSLTGSVNGGCDS